ncbi:hypothetical protein ACFVYJ_03815 [Pontibacter sp. JAM-7]|uniref:hypothetical protein n=1 Tax=Pontibacter sp. JAM-7 TaxID=3366581 RepID=UPI003AF986D8
MLTYKECLDLSDLTSGEVAAIAEHAHVDNMIAMAAGHDLLERRKDPVIRRMILDDIARAECQGDVAHEADLRQVLQQYDQAHKA